MTSATIARLRAHPLRAGAEVALWALAAWAVLLVFGDDNRTRLIVLTLYLSGVAGVSLIRRRRPSPEIHAPRP